MERRPHAIFLVSSEGEGHTLLSAFDSALYNAGVGNYNLIYLSSIIPPRSTLTHVEKYEGSGDYGDRLYVVRAEMRSDAQGAAIGAGVGWYQHDDGSGLFVEHEIESDTEDNARRDLEKMIRESVQDLCAIRGVQWEDSRFHSKVHVTTVGDKPKSVFTCAVFKSESW